MSYFYTENVGRSTLSSLTEKLGSSVSTIAGDSLVSGSIETGFRTRVPHGNLVKVVPDSTADPYSWFMSNEKLKEIAAARDGFDTTSLKLDKVTRGIF